MRFLGADYSEPYIDTKDAQWLRHQGALRPTETSSLTAAEFVVYRFGAFVARLLQHASPATTSDDGGGVVLLLADSLPPNDYSHNCFRRSVFYERAKRALFIRRERTAAVGDFVVVVVHCLAHVAVDDMANDANPAFLRRFYWVGGPWLSVGGPHICGWSSAFRGWSSSLYVVLVSVGGPLLYRWSLSL